MSSNTTLYDKLRSVPEEAKKPIQGGRLKGMTSIEPQWRINRLTDVFGPVGIGWKYEIVRMWREITEESNEVIANVHINLYYKQDGQDGDWSEPVPGIGGSKLQTQERNGLYVSDECFKMALTDAISVAGKVIGLGADVYWDNYESKYDNQYRDDLSIHSLPAIRKRITNKMTDLIKMGKDNTQIYADMELGNVNTESVKEALKNLQWLAEFEKGLDKQL